MLYGIVVVMSGAAHSLFKAAGRRIYLVASH